MIGHPPKSGRSFNPIMGEKTVKTKHLPRKSRCFLCEKSSCVHMGGYTDKGVKETYTYATNPLSPFFHIPINKLTAHSECFFCVRAKSSVSRVNRFRLDLRVLNMVHHFTIITHRVLDV